MPSYTSVTKSSIANDTGVPKVALRAALKKGPLKPAISRKDHQVLVTLPFTLLLGAREETYLSRDV
jgi:hypothetical protein